MVQFHGTISRKALILNTHVNVACRFSPLFAEGLPARDEGAVEKIGSVLHFLPPGGVWRGVGWGYGSAVEICAGVGSPLCNFENNKNFEKNTGM